MLPISQKAWSYISEGNDIIQSSTIVIIAIDNILQFKIPLPVKNENV